MSILDKKVPFTLLIFCLIFTSSAAAETVKGPIILNVDISPGMWKAIRLRNLPKDAVVALGVKSDGEITVTLVNSIDYQRFPNTRKPLFMGRVEKNLSFSVSIPESGHYYVVLDNRTGLHTRAVNITAGASRGKMDRIDKANSILHKFEQQLYHLFIFDSFPIGVERCNTSQAFGESTGIFVCAGYVQQLYDTLRDKQKAQDALGFSIFHEVSCMLLAQWNHPLADKKATADEFAAVLMTMLNQTDRLSANAKNFALDPSKSKELSKVLQDDRHPLTVKRAQKILAWLKDSQLVQKWQKFLVPHMQTILLKKLRQHPTDWTNLSLVEKELALRAKM